MTAPVNHDLMRQEFATRLRAAMFNNRIGAEKLAEKTGLTYRLIRKYLAATSAPLDYFGDPTPNAHRLADGLEIPVTDLVPPIEREPDGTVAA